MKVKFLREFGGRETKEIHYPPDFEVDLEEDTAVDLIERGVCESLEPAPKPDAEPKMRAKSAPATHKAHKKGGEK